MVTAAPISDAIALANSVLPVPGGPQKIMPLGISSSMRADLFLVGQMVLARQQMQDFIAQLCFDLGVAADVLCRR